MSILKKLGSLALQIDAPAKIVLTNPVTRAPLFDKVTGEEAHVMLLSGDSTVAKAHTKAVVDKRFAQRNLKLTSDAIDAEGVELLVKLTKGWLLVDLEGNRLDIDFDVQTARELYSLPETKWIVEQLNEATGDRGNWQQATKTV